MSSLKLTAPQSISERQGASDEPTQVGLFRKSRLEPAVTGNVQELQPVSDTLNAQVPIEEGASRGAAYLLAKEGRVSLAEDWAKTSAAAVLKLGIAELDESLPDQGLPKGQVTELSMPGGLGLGTRFGLWACRAAQQEARVQGTSAWCAVVDCSGSLFAPGVEAQGVELSRLLVVRPPEDSLERTVIKLVESGAFSVVIVDLFALSNGGLLSGSRLNGGRAKALSNWHKIVRRLALAVQNTGTVVLLLTDSQQRMPLALPVGLRLELSERLSVPSAVAEFNERSAGKEGHSSAEREGMARSSFAHKQLRIRVSKHRLGRVGQERSVRLSQSWEATERSVIRKAS